MDNPVPVSLKAGPMGAGVFSDQSTPRLVRMAGKIGSHYIALALSMVMTQLILIITLK
jgi:hypothetical protein